MSLDEQTRIEVREQTVALQLGQEIKEQLDRHSYRMELLSGDQQAQASGAAAGLFGARLSRSFSFLYPHQADTMLNTKMSVSELKKAGMEEEFEEAADLLPSFLRTAKGEGGAARGTGYHRLMELLPFDQIHSEADVSQYLARFVREGRMSEEAAALVRSADIFHFFETELGKRMAAAAAAGTLYKETQFVMGIPAREMGDWDSDELVLIQGIVDAFFEENGAWVLVDYKTDQVKTPEALVKRYRTQLDYYEKALTQMTGKPVRERFLYSYKLGAIRL